MARRKHQREQTPLPLAEADDTAEKRALRVLRAVAQTELLGRLVLCVFHATRDGHPHASPVRRSYRELAELLGCSYGEARACVERARRLGLIQAISGEERTGQQTINGYRIHWPGVNGSLQATMAGGPGVPSSAGPAGFEQGPAGFEQGPAGFEQGPRARAENSPSGNSLLQEQENNSSSFPPSRSARPVEFQQGGAGGKEGGRSFLFENLPPDLAEIPELVEAWPQRVAPLPAGRLVYGPFDKISVEDLRRGFLVTWFRKQLGLRSPLTGDRRTHLLLVLACGLNAANYAAAKSPRQLFAAHIRRGQWAHALRWIPEAAAQLAAALTWRPQCLVHPEGGGPVAEVSQSGVSP